MFKNLPERIQELKNTSKGVAAQGKKRSLPKSAADSLQGQTNVSSLHVSTTGEAVQGPQRARTFPHDVQTTSKRSSNPEPNRVASLDASGFRPGPQASWQTGTLTPESMQSSTGQIQASPQQNNFDPHFDNPNLPDLKNVMFPSGDPFAYPNQPISTLEASQFTPEGQGSFSNIYMGDNMGQPNVSYENLSGPMYGNFAPFMNPSHGQPMSSNAGPYSSMPTRANMGAMPQGGNLDLNQNDEQFWSQMGGGRTGPTPNVNLDDLFGNEQWNPVWDSGPAQTPTFK